MVKGIYKITNDRSGEVYVGQTQNLKARENRHFRELAHGKHHNSGMQDDYNRGDTFTFEVLEELPDATKADLKNQESHYINEFNSFREGYNQTPGGAMDQFQGRYEYGGGRLPPEKYQTTEINQTFERYNSQTVGDQFKEIFIDIGYYIFIFSTFVSPFLNIIHNVLIGRLSFILAVFTVMYLIIILIVEVHSDEAVGRKDVVAFIIAMLWNVFMGFLCFVFYM